MTEKIKIERYKLDTAFAHLADFDSCCNFDDYIELSMWHNGEGFSVHLSSHGDQHFDLTWGQFKAVKKLVKELDG